MNCKKSYTIFIVFLFPALISNAKNPGELAVNQETAVKLYYKAIEFYGTNPDSMLYYAHILEEISEKINYNRGRINAAYLKGDVYNNKNLYEKAARELYHGLDLINQNENSELVKKKVNILQLLGRTYEKTYNYAISKDLYLEALKSARLIRDSTSLAQLNFNIGVVNFYLEEYSPAKSYLNISLNLFQDLNNSYGISRVYNMLGLIEKHQENWEYAIENYQKAMQYTSESNSESIWYISNIGECFYNKNQLETAITYYQKSYQVSLELNDKQKEIWILSNIGDVYQKKGDYIEAVSYYTKSLDLIEDVHTYEKEFARAVKAISTAYEELGQYQKALHFQNQYVAQTESLKDTNEKLHESISQFRMKELEWEMEKERTEIQLTYMRKVNFWFKSSMTLLIIILSLAAYKAIRYYTGIKAVKKWLSSEEY